MDNIQILEIELKDYRQYKGEVVIPLKVESENNINVIQGQNGAGKSNILNAVTLCLYDEEIHIDTNDRQGLDTDPFVNLSRLENLDVGDTARGHVEIKLGREKPQYIFKREFTTGKLGEDEYESDTGELQLHQKIGEDWIPNEQPLTRLSEIIPTRVHKYFFFDGEQLNDFFDKGYTDRVKSAILDVSHIELLNRAASHLEDVQSDFEKESANFEGKTERKERSYREAKEQLEELEDEYSQLETDIEDAEEHKDEIDKKLSDSRDEEVRNKQSRRQYLNEKIDDLKDDLVDARSDAGEALAKAGMVVYNEDALNFARQEFDEMESDGELPPKIQRWFVDQLLERGECICGEHLDGSEEKQEQLLNLRNEVPNTTGETIEGKIEVPSVLTEGEDRVENLIQQKSNVEKIREDISSKETELQEISAFLESKDIPDDIDVNHLETRRKDLESRINEMSEEKGQLESRITRQKSTVNERREEWEEEMEKESKRKVLLRKVEFVQNAKSKVEHIRTNILNQVRQQTEDQLEEYYNSLIWKDEHFDIELTDDYQIKVLSPSGEKALGSLSVGERQVLALSFMASLSQISGFSAPILIDTPLGRISSDPKKRIAQNIPQYLEDTQVTFLMTDEEYTSDVKVFFSDHVANEYKLNYNDEVTEVNPL